MADLKGLTGNKKNMFFSIAQLLILLNCYLCFLNIYEEKLQFVSWILFPLSVLFFLLSKPFKDIKLTSVIYLEIILFIYILIGELVHSNINRLGSQMMISAFFLFFFLSDFYSSEERADYSYFWFFESIAVISCLVSFCSLIVLQNSSITNNFELNGIIVNRNILGIFCAIGAMCSLSLISRKETYLNVLNIFCLSLNVICLLYCQSRNSMVALFIMAVFWAIYVVYANKSRLVIGILMVVLAIAGICLVLFIINRNQIDFNNPWMNVLDNMSSSRLSIWKAGFEIANEYPLLGASGADYERLMVEKIGYSISQHNVFLALASQNGYPSALLYLALLVTGFFKGLILVFKTTGESKKRALMLLGVFTACCFADLLDTFSMALHVPNAFLIFFALGQIQYRYMLCKKA